MIVHIFRCGALLLWENLIGVGPCNKFVKLCKAKENVQDDAASHTVSQVRLPPFQTRRFCLLLRVARDDALHDCENCDLFAHMSIHAVSLLQIATIECKKMCDFISHLDAGRNASCKVSNKQRLPLRC